jgi:hypothetical protein
MKSTLMLFILGLFLSCGFGSPRPKKPVDVSVPVVTEPTPSQPSLPAEGAGEPIVEAPPEEVVVPTPPKEGVKYVDIKTNIKYFGAKNTEARRAKYERAILLFRKVTGLKEFRTAVIEHKKKNGKVGFENTSDSNLAVYNNLLAGAEKLQPAANGTVDMEIEFYYSNNSTVGYTYPNSKRVWVNTKFFDSYSLSSVAANLIHEWLHKLGYGHDSKATAIRPYSVPYGVGTIMRSIGAKYEKDIP